MYDYTGWIVRSAAGHDKQMLLCVVGCEDCVLLLANGKARRVAKPKRKKRGHVEVMSRGDFAHPTIDKLRSGEPVSDSELRRALAAFRDRGGNETWQKAI